MRPLAWALAACIAALATAPVRAVEPIVLGQSLPQRGADGYGRAALVLAGAAAYVAHINARGGIGGRPLKLVTLDDDNDPKQTALNLRSLVRDHKAVALLNCVGDALCKAAALIATELRVPLVGALSGARGLSRAQNPHVFRIRAGYDTEAAAMTRQMKSLGVSRMAIVTDAGADAEPVAALHAALVQAGIEVAVLAKVRPTPEAAEAMLAQLGKGRFNAAVLDLRADTLGLLVDKGLDRRDEWPTTLAALSGGVMNLLMGNFPRSMIGFSAVVPDPERASLPLVQELHRAADLAGGPEATSFDGLEGYISAKVCGEALRRVAGRVDAERLYAALDTLGELDLGGYRVSFTRSRVSGSDYVDVVARPRSRSR